MTKIKKLISGCITFSCCLWFPVSALAMVTLGAVLEEIGISEVDFVAAGLHEQAEEIIRSENERASRDVEHIREITDPSLRSSVNLQAFCGIRPLITVDGIKERIRTSWKNAQWRSGKRILVLLHSEEC